MKIVIELDKEQLLQLVKPLAREIAPLIQPPEEGRLIGRKELERKLNTKNDKKFKEITSRPDFPKMKLTENGHVQWYNKAVDKFLDKQSNL